MSRKLALLVGINYPGTKAELRGCYNDVDRMHCCLVDRFGFDEDDITVLLDRDSSGPQPTGANIRHALARLVGDARSGDFLFFQFSGHGTRLPAETGDDDDTGYDECIVPSDMNLITGATEKTKISFRTCVFLSLFTDEVIGETVGLAYQLWSSENSKVEVKPIFGGDRSTPM